MQIYKKVEISYLDGISDTVALLQPDKAAPPTAHELYFMFDILQK